MLLNLLPLLEEDVPLHGRGRWVPVPRILPAAGAYPASRAVTVHVAALPVVARIPTHAPVLVPVAAATATSALFAAHLTVRPLCAALTARCGPSPVYKPAASSCTASWWPSDDEDLALLLDLFDLIP